MDAYQRQIVPGSYPFALVFIDIDPGWVDVNVHPRKQQVKFLDPGSIFTRVKTAIQDVIGESKVNYASFAQPDIQAT
jgi:DNA mismatch repair protein MutL